MDSTVVDDWWKSWASKVDVKVTVGGAVGSDVLWTMAPSVAPITQALLSVCGETLDPSRSEATVVDLYRVFAW